jgi:glycerol dehydrogenase-like iron-containing ADH family enzyme
MLPAPLTMDVRRGAVAELGALLADSRVATSGRVAVAVGPGQGDHIESLIAPTLGEAEVFRVADGTVDAAVSLGADLRKGAYEVVVGVGGGKTIDATKYAASLAGIPMVAVATNLSHDGICSPTASLVYEGGKGTFGVPMPLAILVDLDFVHSAPKSLVRAGVGDVISNLSAIEDWQLGNVERGEPIDGLACSMSRTAAEALIGRKDSIESALPRHLQPRRARRHRCRLLLLPARGRRPRRAGRRLPAPPRAARRARGHRAECRAVRRGRRTGPGHSPRPLHDPGAPADAGFGDSRSGGGLCPGLR